MMQGRFKSLVQAESTTYSAASPGLTSSLSSSRPHRPLVGQGRKFYPQRPRRARSNPRSYFARTPAGSIHKTSYFFTGEASPLAWSFQCKMLPAPCLSAYTRHWVLAELEKQINTETISSRLGLNPIPSSILKVKPNDENIPSFSSPPSLASGMSIRTFIYLRLGSHRTGERTGVHCTTTTACAEL